MFGQRLRRITLSFITISFLSCCLTLYSGSLGSPATAQEEFTETLPYPTQLVPGQNECIILDRESEDLTTQEEYARDNWGFPERWIWRQVCAGKEANLYRFFLGALLANHLKITKEDLDEHNYDIGAVIDSKDELKKEITLKEVFEDLEISSSEEPEYGIKNIEYLIQPARISMQDSVKDVIKGLATHPSSWKALFDLVQILDESSNKEEAGKDSLDKLIKEGLDELAKEKEDEKSDFSEDKAKKLLSRLFKNEYESWASSENSFEPFIQENFLRTILFREPFQSALPSSITIRGGIYNEEINLSSSEISQELRLIDSHFKGDLRLYKSTFLKSLSLDNSQFEKGFYFQSGKIQDELFMRNVEFDPEGSDDRLDFNSLNGHNLIFNDSTLKGEINLTDANINNMEMKNIDYEGGTLNLSSLNGHNLNFNDSTLKGEINLTDANINNMEMKNIDYEGGTLNLSSLNGHNLNFNSITLNGKLNLSNASINNLEINITDIKDLDNVFRNSINLILYYNDHHDLLELEGDFELNLRGLSASKVVFPFDFMDRKLRKTDEERILSGVKLSEANISELSITVDDESIDTVSSCDISLDDFQYQEVNSEAFSFLTSCLEAKYNHAAPSTWKQMVGKNAGDIHPRDLLQPFEQAANVARSLGRYRKERELLYKQKRLELFVEKDNPEKFSWSDLSKSKYWQLSIRDFLYGFSYQRFKALKFFILVWLVGTFLAFKRILHKQSEIVDKVIGTRALEDKLFTKTSAPRVPLNRLLKNNNLIAKLFFARLLEDKSLDKLDDFDLYVQFEEADANLGKILDADKAAKLNKQAPDYIKVDPQSTSNQVASSKHDQNLRGFLDMVDAKGIEVLGYCKHIFPGSGRWIFDQDPQLSDSKDLRMVNINEREIVEYHYPHLSSESRKSSALHTRWSFIVAAIIIFIAVSLLLYFPDSASFSFIVRWSLFLVPTLIALVFLRSHFNRWDFRVAWLAAVFSLDILLPIINLDEQLQSFVFEGAEGGIRLYFLAEKLLAAVLAGILLPIFFVAGL